MSSRKILFISHDASRTGAPILVLNLIKALQEHSDITFDFLVKGGGAILNEFKSLAETHVFYKTLKYDFLSRAKRRIIKETKYNDISKLDWQSYYIVFANTITNGDILPVIRKYYKGPIISYIHELEIGTKFFTTEAQVNDLIKHTDFFLAPSLAVSTYLENTFKIDSAKIALLPYYIPPFKSNKSITDTSKPSSKQEFIVGGSGTFDWRKSPELLVQIAIAVSRVKPDFAIKFVWKGGDIRGTEFDKLNYDIKKSGLTGKIVLEPSGSDMNAFFEKIDVFVLTSREDPYPLVVLEAADSEVPTICFAGSGGANEFVSNDAGVIVPFLDVQVAAEAIINFYENRELLKQIGKRAKQKVLSKHQDSLAIYNQFDTIITNCINLHIS